MRVPTALHLCQHLVLTVFFILTIVTCKYVIMDLIFISLMAIDIELLFFVCFCVIFLFSLVYTFCPLLDCVFSSYSILRALYITVNKRPLSDIWFANLFSEFVGYLSNLLNISHRGKVLNFDKDIYQSFMLYLYDVLFKKSLLNPRSQRFPTPHVFFL